MVEWKAYRKKVRPKNLPAITNKYDQMNKKCRRELINESKKSNQIEDFHIMI